MMSEVQALFLYPSSTNCSDPADSPSDSLRKILDVKGTAAAVYRLELLLLSKFNRQFFHPAPLFTNIRAGAFSDALEKGGSISIFYFFNPSNSLSSQHDMAALQVQVAKGTSFLVEQISMQLANCKDHISVPTSVQILREGIRRFCEFCDFIFGEDFYVVHQLSFWDSHISRHEHTYTSC